MFPLLQLGSSGAPVKTLQTQLKAILNLGSSFEVNGQFDAQTQAAVKSFQQQHHLTVDGTAGSETCAELNRLYAQLADTSSSSTNAESGAVETALPTQTQTSQATDLSALVQQLEKAIESQVAAAESKVAALEQRAAQLQKAIAQALQILEGGTNR